uniref:Uncharacterized protein n=1 Tax=Anguilla anguilla TaxID=7936 RepID=A0A0E9TD72_ANGAN
MSHRVLYFCPSFSTSLHWLPISGHIKFKTLVPAY